MNKIKKIAREAVLEAGKMLELGYNKFKRSSAHFKSHREIVTKYDLASEKIIIKKIKQNFPTHQILSEEAGEKHNQGDYLWIIDPIDGTTNFSMHNPLWAISVGVAHIDNFKKRKELEFGIVYAPILGEMFEAQKGKGTRLNGHKIKPSDINAGRGLHAFCHSSHKKDIKKALKYLSYQKLNNFDCRQLGSASIELAYVACGRLESIMIPGAHTWDVAAGTLLVREAGGMVSDFNGKKWSLDSNDILASNKKLHKEILKIISDLSII